MILDLRSDGLPAELQFDLCIVGSGAAGLAIASEMPATVNVVVVESGGLEPEPQTQSLYEREITGLPHPGSIQGRFRIFGGSTTQWGGQALPLMDHDLNQRDWIPYTGWPLSAADLKPYYHRACRFLRLDSKNFDTELFPYLNARRPAFAEEDIWYHFSKWSPTPNTREEYLPFFRRAERMTLLLHANVCHIALADGLNRVEAVTIRSLDGKSAKVRARAFALCVGGIETARLLLANNRQQANGIGNARDLVGRFFQDHPSATIGYLTPTNMRRAQYALNVLHKRGLKYSVRCTATAGWQRRHRTLNVSMGTMFISGDDTLQAMKNVYGAIKRRQVGRRELVNFLRATRRPSRVLVPSWYYAVRGRSFAPAARIQINLTSEQEPNPESRIQLANRTDALGMPLASVGWKLTNLTWHTMKEYAALLVGEFRRIGLGQIELEPWLRDDSVDWAQYITDQNHHMGTTRMHDSPNEGVVASDCRVHGISNLFIGSSAVFPTSGHSNPTLTIIALCIRIADQLKAEVSHAAEPGTADETRGRIKLGQVGLAN
ncbi:MAG TPA: GMC family oxidoreductase [Terriglobales bacterium]|nr:GMC family oxidoreductase [Terriglobales bacterium]